MNSNTVMTHAEIARQLGISRARVYQLERSALTKLARRLGPRLMMERTTNERNSQDDTR